MFGDLGRSISKANLPQVYTAELESVPEYNGFKEWLESFQLLRGKRTGDENDDERRIVGIFKGSLRVHR